MKSEQTYRTIAHESAKRSPCLSRHYGCVLVNRNNRILSTGFNTPIFSSMICEDECPRKKIGFPSGTGTYICPAIHAEIMCLIRAELNPIDSTLYVSGCIPCKNCLSALILAGISNIVCEELTYYDEISKKIHQKSNLLIRKYKEK